MCDCCQLREPTHRVGPDVYCIVCLPLENPNELTFDQLSNRIDAFEDLMDADTPYNPTLNPHYLNLIAEWSLRVRTRTYDTLTLGAS